MCQEQSSPVLSLAELLLESPDDDLLHPLVGLGDEVHGGALRLDLDLALPGRPDHLDNQNPIGSFVGIWRF